MSGERPGASERIRQWLKQHEQGGFCTDIARDIGQPTDSVSALLKQMEDRGELVGCMVLRDHRKRRFYRLSARAGSPTPPTPWRNLSVGTKPSARRDTLAPRYPVAPTTEAPADPIAPAASESEPPVDQSALVIATAAMQAADRMADPPQPEPPVDTGIRNVVSWGGDASEPRFALYSDGTLILEGLPNLPDIIAIRPEHSRQLVAYLRGEADA
ncbi:MAG: hypothetical protein GC151_13750 [Betaproteobacteria bacterium]|nr:hypothetical protein [Betaproteobacteria bacterium]